MTAAIVVLRAYASLLILIGLGLAGGGGYLLTLHGSPYYLLCGLAIAASGVLLWQRRGVGVTLYGAMLFATVIWAIWESGFYGWALMPRIVGPVVLGIVLLIPWLRRVLTWGSPAWPCINIVGAAIGAVIMGAALHAAVPPPMPADPMYQMGIAAAPDHDASTAAPAAETGNDDWRYYGNDAGGMRYSNLTQITPDNVATLEPAWTFKIDAIKRYHTLEVTPLKIGRTLYMCSAVNDVIALDAETGKQLWRFDAHVDDSLPVAIACRGVSYHQTPGATGPCAESVFTNTVDGRLIALDAKDGTLCPNFGVNGTVSLLTGMGEVKDGYYGVTSAPTIVGDKIVLGGMVLDNQYWGEPSGVIRAFDVHTGALAWAFDMGRPDRTAAPAEGETYTRSTPNSWGPMSADEKLGLVYVPTGNAPPDHVGIYRRPFDEEYASAVVALDIATGRPRWVFQTAHHDLWDYDIPAQPTLIDFPTADGPVQALIQTTKRGEIFVLDRATGKPLTPVEERGAPQSGTVPEEHPAATQPFSVGMPSFRGADLTEGKMWGITPLDQLWCRIKFREARYDGPNTPPGLTPAVSSPGYLGGMEWGGVAVDTSRHVMIINTNAMANYMQLLPRAEADALGLKPYDPKTMDHGRVAMMNASAETPYGTIMKPFLSPLYVPCQQPPFGRLSAVDLKTGKLIWTQVFGTARDQGPLGIRSGLPLPLGTINIGGSVVTRSGLFFIAATQDRYLRAYETTTGKLLWQASMPLTGKATPMTYISPESGKQFVVVASGSGHKPSDTSDYLVAYRLPTGGAGEAAKK